MVEVSEVKPKIKRVYKNGNKAEDKRIELRKKLKETWADFDKLLSPTDKDRYWFFITGILIQEEDMAMVKEEYWDDLRVMSEKHDIQPNYELFEEVYAALLKSYKKLMYLGEYSINYDY